MSVLTQAHLTEMWERIQTLNVPQEPRIYVTLAAVLPVKTYPKRKRDRTNRYARMSKKWLKRYGVKPAIFHSRKGLFGGPSIYVHPLLASQVKTALRQSHTALGAKEGGT